MGLFDGQVALITGGARGMGRSHAVELARQGADVALLDVCAQLDTVEYAMSGPEDLDETVALVEKEGRRALPIRADVRDFAAVEGAVAQTVSELGRLDIAIANAGISAGDAIQVADPVAWEDVIGINLTGVFHTFRAAAPVMVQQRYGRLIGISSMMGRAPTGGMGAYVAAKWGVIGLVKSSAQDLARFGVTVNAIAPGNVDTPMVHNEFLARKLRPDLENPVFEDALKYLGMLHVQPDPILQPQEITDAIVFLLSPAGRHMTGTVIDMSAGATSRGNA